MSENIKLTAEQQKIADYVIEQIQNKDSGYRARAIINGGFHNLKRDVSTRATTTQLEEVKTIASNAVAGMKPMGKVANITELNAKPKVENDSYFRLDTVDENNNPYIWRYNINRNNAGEITSQGWVNTYQIVYVQDAAMKGVFNGTLSDLDKDISGSYFKNVGTISNVGKIGLTYVTRRYTDPIDITIAEKIRVQGTADNDSNVLSFYDDKDVFIEGISGRENDDKLIVIAKEDFPPGAKYIRAMSSNNGAKYLVVNTIYDAMTQIEIAKKQSIGQTNSIIKAIESQKYIDNTDNSIVYVGSWSHNQDHTSDYNGGNSASSTKGDYFEVSFFGSSISIYHRSGPSRGIVEVFVDDVSHGTVDAFSEVVKHKALLTTINGLDKGIHKLKVVNTGSRNNISTSALFLFDYIELETNSLNLNTLKDNQIENVPYLQISSKKNANQPLRIETYDGGNEGLHPKVLYFKNSFNGWKYWLVFSPYKNKNEAIENPCIYVSQNGINWDVPVGLINPLDDVQDVRIEYNSDPHLVYNETTKELECWWRWVGRENHPTKKNTETIYRRKTKDGITWTEKEFCFEWENVENSTRAVISPSVIYEDGKYKMWASHSIDEPGTVRPIGYWESSDAKSWTKITDIDLGTVTPSHLDVVKWKGKYRMVVFDVKKDGYPYFYLESADNITWSEPYKILTRGNPGAWDSGTLYRPSLCVVDGWMRLYYSAYSDFGTNYVGLIIFDEFDSLKITT